MPTAKVICTHCEHLLTPAVARRHIRLYSTPQLQYLRHRNHPVLVPNTPLFDHTDTTNQLETVDGGHTPHNQLDEIYPLQGIQNTIWHSSIRRAIVEDDNEDDELAGTGQFFEQDGHSSDEPAPTTELSPDDLEELTIYEQLAESFERNMANLDQLSSQDLSILRAYAFKIRSRLTLEAFKMLPFAFEGISVESADEINSRAAFLSGLDPVLYHCCPNSCCLYVGPHSELSECPYCKEPRYNARKQPRKVFTYIPLIPRLTELFKNVDMRHKLDYRANFQLSPSRECSKHDGRKCYCPSRIADIFDGSRYRRLLDSKVTINGRELIHAYFSDLRDIALGYSTDGFSPFKRRKHTAWPLIIYNLNLPPDERFHKENIICIGVIPGPKKPHDFDSFLWPLIEELVKLAHGVTTFDVVKQEMFALHAYLIFGAGDIPAMSMVMRMKGHNALKPCRMCEIRGVRIPNNPRSKTHYVPLNRTRHPLTRSDPSTIPQYDPHNLPLRTHSRFLEQAREVQLSLSRTEEENLAKTYGIKGMPLLACLGSLDFPTSFPYDFMHLFWANVIPNLVRLWTGEYKDLNEGSGSYRLQPSVWEAIGKACAESGASIPSAYSARPMDINRERHLFNCDMWSFWTLYLSPILLHNRFLEAKYYKHFVQLVKLLNICLKFEMTATELDFLREGFIQWVQRYEELYYQYSPVRVSVCPLTIHAILHIADSIEMMGPVWVYWAFPMERFCGRLQPHIKSRRFPFANIDAFVVADARLTHLALKFNITQELSLKPAKNEIRHQEYVHPASGYPSTVLAPPRRVGTTDQALLTRIAVCLATRFSIPIRDARRIVSAAQLELFSRVRHLEGGDTIYASEMNPSVTEDRRDATFIRYELLVDIFARRRNLEPSFQLDTFYGQLLHIVVIHMPSDVLSGTHNNETLFLADIHSVKIECKNDLDMHYYSQMGQREVVDMSCVQCLVGRVKVTTQTGSRWAIIDRSGELARALYVENET